MPAVYTNIYRRATIIIIIRGLCSRRVRSASIETAACAHARPARGYILRINDCCMRGRCV